MLDAGETPGLRADPDLKKTRVPPKVRLWKCPRAVAIGRSGTSGTDVGEEGRKMLQEKNNTITPTEARQTIITCAYGLQKRYQSQRRYLP